MQSSDFVLNLYPETNGSFVPLNGALASQLRLISQVDASWSYRSSILSIVSALNGLDAGYRSWPIVQLYYSVFYSIRSILYSNGICLYYCKNKPMIIDATAGGGPAQMTFKGSGSSHISAFKIFLDRFPSHPLNGDIDFDRALHWLRKARETVNYTDSLMNLDDRLSLFSRVDRSGVRSSLSTYMEDLNLFAFLPDDAMLAFPLYAAEQATKSMAVSMPTDCKSFIQETILRVRDRSGVIPSFNAFVPA